MIEPEKKLANDGQILWAGTVSSDYKKRCLGQSILWFGMITVSLLGIGLVLFGSTTDHGSINNENFISFLVIGGFILMSSISSIGILHHIFNLYPRYFVSTEKLMIKHRSMGGKESLETFDLKIIRTIYFVDETYRDKNCFLFFQKTVDELLEERTLKDLKYSSILLKGKIGTFIFGRSGDFMFESVDTPKELMSVLESLISMKLHPTLKNVYQRVNI